MNRGGYVCPCKRHKKQSLRAISGCLGRPTERRTSGTGGTWILAWPPQRCEVTHLSGSFDAEARPRNLQCPHQQVSMAAARSHGLPVPALPAAWTTAKTINTAISSRPLPELYRHQGVTPLAGAVQRRGWFTGSCSASKADEVVLTGLAGLGCQWQALAEPWTSPR